MTIRAMIFDKVSDGPMWHRLMWPFATAAPLIVLLVGWQAYAGSDRTRQFFYSTPVAVARSMFADLRDNSLLADAGVTATETLVGFVLGNLTGTVVGLTLWSAEPLARVSRPYLAAAGAFPVFAIAPMTILWFGTGLGAKVALAFLATVFLATAQAYKGARQVDPLLVRRLRVMGAGPWTTFRHLLFPTAVVWIVSSLRLSVGAALMGAFIGELIATGSERGLGYRIVRASGLYDTARVIGGVTTMVVIALTLDGAVTLLEWRLLRWRRPGTHLR